MTGPTGPAAGIPVIPAPTTGADTAAAPAATAPGADPATNPAADPNAAAGGAMPAGMAGAMKWLPALGVVGGAGMAAWGAYGLAAKGKGVGKIIGGALGVLGGLFMTMQASKADGVAQGQKAGWDLGVQAGYEAGGTEGYNKGMEDTLAEIERQKAQNGGVLPGTPGDPNTTPGTPTPDPTTPGSPTTPGTLTTPGTPTTPDTTTSWTPQAVLGKAVTLGAGTYGGDTVAAAGPFILRSQLGDPNGYATLDEADAVARANISDVWNTQAARWVVLQQNGKYYAYAGEADSAGGTVGGAAAATLPAEGGQVVAWHSLKMLLNGWVSFHSKNGQGAAEPWSRGGGQVAPGTTTPDPGPATPSAPGTGEQPVPTSPSTPVTPAPTSPTIGAGVAGVLGAGFAMTSSSGTAVIQAQKPIGSATGYATPGEAAQAVVDDRAAAPGGQFDRWVTVQGTDSKFYAFRGSVVSGDVTSFPTGVAPMHVFGQSFGAWFDGATWQAQAA